jgi:hypothetical protein
VVLLELLAHLGDPEDLSYDVCKSACCAAVHHCLMPLPEGGHSVAIAPNTDLQLCTALWGQVPGELVANDDFIRALALRVSEDPSEVALDTFRDELCRVAEKFAETEREFAKGTEPHLMSSVEVAARDLGYVGDRSELRQQYLKYLDTKPAFEAVARAHVLRARDHTTLGEGEAGVDDRARWVADAFEVAIRVYLEMVKKILTSNWVLGLGGKGANLLWDMQVGFLVGQDHRCQGRPIWVVTGDRDIVDAAAAAGAGDVILDYGEYRKRLNILGPAV